MSRVADQHDDDDDVDFGNAKTTACLLTAPIPECRKRTADSLGRLATGDASGRGALAGWTTCPLCGRHSKKRFALGRGIASHLHHVHTPWKPLSKVERKKRRRLSERQEQQRWKQKKGDVAEELLKANSVFKPATMIEPSEGWEPTQQEIDDWDAKVLQIVAQVEETTVASTQQDKTTERIKSGLDRNGKEAKTYRESLPLFLQAAADGNIVQLRSMVSAVDEDKTDGILQLLSTKDRHQSSAEHWAAGGGHLECLRYLLKLRSEHEPKNYLQQEEPLVPQKTTRRRDGKTCLHYAARNGHVVCIEDLLDKHTCKVDELSGDGTTPLHLACFGGHYNAVECLLQRGANAHATNEWGCGTAHWIGMTQNKSANEIWKLCRLLQSHKVSFWMRQNQGHSPLHKAAQRCNCHVIEWMASTVEEGGAGLSTEQKMEAGKRDQGGHKPSDIWWKVGGEEEFRQRMKEELQW